MLDKEYLSMRIYFDQELGAIAAILTEMVSKGWDFTEMNRAEIVRDNEGGLVGLQISLVRDKQLLKKDENIEC